MKTLHVTAITLVTALTLFFSPSLSQAQDWYDTDWSYRKAITIDADQVSASLSDFPLLVNTNDSHLLANAESTGVDILFTAADGTSLLDYEIESYSNTTALVAWVRIDTLSDTTDTVIYMYYDNPSATSLEDANGVWDSNYVMVQHLNETSGDHLDSTSNGNDGTAAVTTQGSASGQINGADEFGGSPDIVNCGNATILDITGSMTVEAWAYPNTSAASTRISSKDATGVTGKFILWVNSSGDLAFIVTDGTGPGGSDPWFRAKDLTNSITPDVWFHVVGVFDADTQEVRLYKDGVEVAAVAGPTALKSNTETVTIGASDNNAQNWDGILDEVRISNTAMSADWILTSYTNQNEPGSFYEIADEETQCTDDNDCDDGVPCTDDTCAAGTCVFTPNNANCDDLVACTDDVCDAVAGCQFTPNDGNCDDSVDCTDDTCDETNGCQFAPNDTLCDDGIDCTDDTCDETSDCQFTPNDGNCTDDALYCTGDEYCDAATGCSSTGDPCAPTQLCDEGIDQCVDCQGNGDCNDGVDCTDDTCDAGSCVYTPNDGNCSDDGLYCTGDEYCDAATGCSSTGDPCPPQVCDEGSGACVDCLVAGDCDDGVDCTDDSCVANACANTPNDVNCPDDGIYCNGTEYCDAAIDCSSTGDPCISPEVCDDDSDLCVAGTPGSWWNCAWPYRKELTIDNTKVAEDLTEFPVLIDLTDAELAANAQINGEDIVFTDIYGTTLSHEIEFYNDVDGHLIAWVNVPSLSSTVDTTLFMYFGNSDVGSQEDPAGTWANNHVMVQHLAETTGTHFDSTGNGNDGAAEDMGTDQDAQGRIDGADGFDGTNNLVRMQNSGSLDITGSMTVEAWAFSAGGTTGPVRILSKDMTGEAGKFILWQNSAGELAYIVTDGIGNPPSPTDPWYRAVGSPVTEGEWFQVVGVFDAGSQQVRLYKNGDLVTEVDGPAFLQSNTESVTIGSSDNSEHFWNGTIDEVRISDVARSAGWIKTSHNNQFEPASFFVLPMGNVVNLCEGNFDCDENVDGSDARLFKLDFGRPFQDPPPQRPCTDGDPCNGDFDCDGDVDGSDAQTFKRDFGRSTYFNPCPPCVEGECCSY